MMMGVRQLESVLCLLCLTQDILREIWLEDPDDDLQLQVIYADALLRVSVLLQDTIVAVATYCGSYLEYDVGCEGTD
jgi:hypothetical protein